MNEPGFLHDLLILFGLGVAVVLLFHRAKVPPIVEVRCGPGDRVEKGDVVLVIESMKMNNELRSPAAGTVETVPVGAGQRVKANELLVSIRTGEG